jgi:sugar lactone lactonase YvrE
VRTIASHKTITGIAAVAVAAAVASPTGLGNAATPRTAHALLNSPVGSIYASDFFTAGLLAYNPGSKGDAAPYREITGADTGMTEVTDVAVDSSGTAYLSDDGQSILEYFADSTGDSTPEATITGPATGLDEPSALALAPNGNIWVANFNGGSLREFAAGASGNATPIAVIQGPKTGLGDVAGIAVSPDGTHVWASNDVTSAGSITEYPTTKTGNVAPIATIAGTNTTMEVNPPAGLAVDTDGTVWLALDSSVSPAVVAFAPGAKGNVQPAVVIAGGAAGLSRPDGISLDPDGDVWVADEGNQKVAEWKTGNQTTGAAPDVTISGADTGLGQQDSPDGVAIYSIRPSPPSNLVAAPAKAGVALRWQAPPASSNSGPVTGYIVDRATSATGQFVPIAQTSRTSYTDHKVTFGKRYYYRLYADNHVRISQSGEDDQSATPIAPPSAPRAVKAKRGHRSLTVSWQPPAHLTGSTITGYTIEYATCKVGGLRCKAKDMKVSKTSRHRTIRGLHAGKRYFAVVLARSSAGNGRASKRVTATPKA